MIRIIIGALSILLLSCNNDNENLSGDVLIEFRLAEKSPGKDLEEYKFKNFNKKFYLHKEVLCDNKDLESAEIVKWENEYAVKIKFSKQGAEKWIQITGNNIGKNIAFLVNNELVICPVIQAEMDEGIAIINGGFSEKKAREIAEGIGTN